MDNRIIESIKEKYNQLGENTATYLKGLLHAKPINYWDYIEVDTLLSLQRPRTNFKDEEIFIMYHQMTEIILKMMLHEIRQLTGERFEESVWTDKIQRLNRYTSILINSFDVMQYGMNYDDYNTFRATLTPASGFQSVQFRYIEIHCTRLENLLSKEGKEKCNNDVTDISLCFEHLYWKDAGTDRATGKKSLTLSQFEEKYQAGLIQMAFNLKGKTLEDKVIRQQYISDDLREKLREFDHLYNVTWPMIHLQTAQHYLDSKGENKAATGGSEWKKYLHPKFQKRKFFPSLWTDTELVEWGIE